MKKLLILMLTIILCGCANYREINDLIIVKSVYISKDEIIVETIEDFIKYNNKNISEVFNDKHLFISNLNYIVINNDMINEIDKSLDYLARENSLPLNYLIYIGSSNKINSEYYLTIKDLLTCYLKNNICIYPTSDNKLVFYKDNEQIMLNDEETIGYNLINNNLKTISSNDYTFNIISSNLKYKDNITVEGILEVELMNKSVNKSVDAIINYLGNDVIRYINSILSLCKKTNSDLLNINDYLYKNYLINDSILNINFDYNINIIIKGIGNTYE